MGVKAIVAVVPQHINIAYGHILQIRKKIE